MASSPRHSTLHPTLLLRRHYPNFCALAPLRPTRQLPSLPQQQLQQKQHVGHDPSPSEPTTAAASPATAAAAGALRVGIVGFGNFGQFIAGGIQRQGHAVLATSRSDYSGYCARHGIRFFATADELCEAGPDVLLVCSSILSTEAVVRAIPFRKLRPGTLVADVLSVKQFPRNLLLEVHTPTLSPANTSHQFNRPLIALVASSHQHHLSNQILLPPIRYDHVTVIGD
jgi:arogenate dehydrogenase (NADP+)